MFQISNKKYKHMMGLPDQPQSHFFRADGHMPSTFYGVNVLGLATCKICKYTYNQRFFLLDWNTEPCANDCEWLGHEKILESTFFVQFYIQKKETPRVPWWSDWRCHAQKNHVHICIWNPNDPCFYWNFGLVLKGSTTKIEDKQVPGIYIYQ